MNDDTAEFVNTALARIAKSAARTVGRKRARKVIQQTAARARFWRAIEKRQQRQRNSFE